MRASRYSLFMIREVGSLLLFFGTFNSDHALHRSGHEALQELSVRGYTLSEGNDAIRVYPAESRDFDGHQAGGWRPGVITLRERPEGEFSPSVFLRHELMHEALYRTCGGSQPVWVQEAAAIAFSGESALASAGPDQAAIDALAAAVRNDAPIRAAEYETLRRLVSLHGWPEKPCEASATIAEVLGASSAMDRSPPAVLVMSVLSGRLLFEQGATKAKLPPGSLLKIPYAAALSPGNEREVAQELVRSDTEALAARAGSLRKDVLLQLLHPVKEARPLVEGEDWRQLLGERRGDGSYPIETDLHTLGMVLRNSLLEHPKSFGGLTENGRSPGSTLSAAPESLKKFMRSFRVLAKTGSASNTFGSPLVGSLMLAWPAEDPQFLALVRAPSLRGAGISNHLSALLPIFRTRFSPSAGKVRMRILSGVSPADVQWKAPCDVMSKSVGDREIHFSECGDIEVRTEAKGARTTRWFRGLIEARKGVMTLVTDPETYADAVLEAEADEVKGRARAALRAVIHWNGIHGRHRHAWWSGLCDLTHCMVNRGMKTPVPDRLSESTDPALLNALQELSKKREESWFPFSKGGLEQWERKFASAQLEAAVNEPTVLSVQRERTRTGDVIIHLVYTDASESVPCELFRARLKLPSCPAEILASDHGWTFRGAGEGHGQGLDLSRAVQLAESGRSARDILTDAYSQ